jgi:threonine/homoserine/homoserine lactone efflux protein
VAGIHDFGLFLLAAVTLNLMPGADTLLVIGRSAAGGFRAGAAAALGIMVGCLLHAVAAALGVAALLAASPWGFRMLSWLGAGYLAWLGLRMLLRPDQSLSIAKVVVPGWRASFGQGLLTNVLNPKVGLFFLAFVPQFVDADAPSPLAAFVTLGLVFDLTGGVWLMIVAALTAGAAFAVSGRTARWLRGAGGMMFLVLAWRLAFDGRGA